MIYMYIKMYNAEGVQIALGQSEPPSMLNLLDLRDCVQFLPTAQISTHFIPSILSLMMLTISCINGKQFGKSKILIR